MGVGCLNTISGSDVVIASPVGEAGFGAVRIVLTAQRVAHQIEQFPGWFTERALSFDKRYLQVYTPRVYIWLGFVCK